jgi:hypothetical protein
VASVALALSFDGFGNELPARSTGDQILGGQGAEAAFVVIH